MIKSRIFDKSGKPITFSKPANVKLAFGEYNSLYEYPWAGRMHPRVYTTQDAELGVNQYNRDLLQRWSREACAKQPWIYAAIKVLSSFSVGTEYKVTYTGNNSIWGKQFEDYMHQVFYPNCCNRGPNYDFQTDIGLISELIDRDGDLLLVFGEDETGPKFQMIPSHRIRTIGSNPFTIMEELKPGPYPNTILSDGVVYNTKTGMPLAYSILNPENLVNSSFTGAGTEGQSQFVTVRNSRLIYIPRYPDRGRGIPSIANGIIQALSVEEIESYEIEKMKIQSMYAVVEKTPEGEGPLEEEQAYRRAVNSNNNALQGFNLISNPNDNASQGLRVVSKPNIKYVSCAGGEVKFPSNSVTDKESADFLTRLEQGVLSCLGVPHALLFSPDDVAGKMNNSVIGIFNTAIEKRQQLLDFHGKFIIAWAASKAIQRGDLPPNDEEVLTNCFRFTHPQKFSLEDNKTKDTDMNYYQGGGYTLDDIAKKNNTTAEKLIGQKTKESIMMFNAAKQISNETGIDIMVAVQSLRSDLKQKPASFGGNGEQPSQE